ncbi:EamA family transporter [Oleiharenicola lentus]|uniref:EamA family transporter n=1 Tax=Oleiharenicola lentus TaxID=2508720 RepID=UPI003F66DDBD
MSAPIPFRHLLIALLVVAIWGLNFVAIKVALRDLPPLLLCAVRFTLVGFPMALLVPRPAIPWRQLASYGATMFGLHFGFLFLGMKLGMSAGLASLTLQFQVFVTLALAAWTLKERISGIQIAGMCTAVAGFAVVAMHTGGDVTVAGLGCVLIAACSWGFANVASKRIGRVNPLALVAWGSLVVPVPMLGASLMFEGRDAVLNSLTQVSGAGITSVAFIVYGSTLLAYSLWSWLLARHPSSVVAPFMLLVPIFGMISSALILGESLPAWKFQAAALVLSGLLLNLFGPRLWAMRRSAAQT